MKIDYTMKINLVNCMGKITFNVQDAGRVELVYKMFYP